MNSPSKISTTMTLDESLRYLYTAIVYLEVHLLAIRFEFNGKVWEADTPDEAIVLREKLEWSTRFPLILMRRWTSRTDSGRLIGSLT